MPAQTAVILNAKGRNRVLPGWMGRHSWRHKGYLQIAGVMLPLGGVWRRYNMRARPGRGRRDKNMSKATLFSLFGNNKIMPSFQISCFSCAFALFEDQYNHADLCAYV